MTMRFDGRVAVVTGANLDVRVLAPGLVDLARRADDFHALTGLD